MIYNTQSDHAVRFEWGMQGVRSVANLSGVVVIVDVLSFSTCVDIACERDAVVLPYQYKDASVVDFARASDALVANKRAEKGFSLSPQSLLSIPAATRLVLPSPNGATLSLACSAPVVLAGCLRNAQAVAAFASRHPGPITVIAAGERWDDGALRPAIEDLLGAGAIVHYLQWAKSPEAKVAEAAFIGALPTLAAIVNASSSGIELHDKGFPGDVELAIALNSSACVPRLINGAYIRADSQP
jgi:2-phosphosulfolactate phosphatase